MEPSLLIQFGFILLFSFVQSVLGVGLLVFGTPTFLILGLSFPEALSILLPSSVVISSFQYFSSKELIKRNKKEIALYSLPLMILGISVVLFSKVQINVKMLIAIMLIFTSIVRMSKTVSSKVNFLLNKYKKIYLMVMGAIHGLSNLGGGLLTIFAGSVTSSKEDFRGTIAFGYLLFGVFQLMLLFYFDPKLIRPEILLFMVFSGVIYQFLGNKLFGITSEKVYGHLITGLTLLYGIFLIVF